MFKKKIFVSLTVKLIIVLVIALLVASAVFAGVKELGDFLVWRYFLDESDRQERAEGYVEDFQKYVTHNKLSVKDSSRISSWSAGSYVDMIIYKDSTLFYAPEWFKDFNGESEDAIEEILENTEPFEREESFSENDGESQSFESDTEELVDTETTPLEESGSDGDVTETVYESQEFVDKGWFSGDRGFVQYLTQEARETYLNRVDDILEGNQELMPIYFVDGTLFVMVVDYTEEFLSNLVFAIAIVAALIVLLVIMLINFSGTTMRIRRLANNVKLVERGDLDRPIKVEGNDEITALATDVNSMRNSVIDNMTKEKQAWEANAELITAMSHDVRTPLTVMLGYLDLMELQNSDDANEEYISACKENALKLKRLSDDMFSYFLVFGQKDIMPETLEAQDTDPFEHMISEHKMLLEENGYVFVHEGEMPRVKIIADTMFLGRVIDNVFSNIAKYADPSYPVTMRAELDNGFLKISVSNRIKRDDSRAESNHIGIKTCVRIMEKMNGGFDTVSDDDTFTATVIISAVTD